MVIVGSRTNYITDGVKERVKAKGSQTTLTNESCGEAITSSILKYVELTVSEWYRASIDTQSVLPIHYIVYPRPPVQTLTITDVCFSSLCRCISLNNESQIQI